MTGLSFDWDENKHALNIKKHKVSFQEAQTVFYDDYARIISDPDHSETEDRFILMGLSYHLRILVVVHCYRQEDSVIRIISARKASKSERKNYLKRL